MTQKDFGLLRKILAPIIVIVGPATVMAAGIMGAGSTASLLSAGCWFGYKLMWVVFLSLPVIVVCQDTASRIGAVADGKGMMRIISDETNPLVMWIIVVPVIFVCVTANIGQLGAMTDATGNIINLIAGRELIGAKPPLWVNGVMYIGLAVVALMVNAFGGYKRIEKLLTFSLFVVLVSFLLVAIQAFFHIEQVKAMLLGLVPRFPADIPIPNTDPTEIRRYLISFSAIIGGGVAATAILSFPYFTTEGGYTKENIRARLKKHILLFGVTFGVYSCILLIAGAYALHNLDGSAGFNKGRQMAMALEQILGPTGIVFFSIGLFICGFNTLTVVAQLGSYFLLDCLGLNWRFEKTNRRFLIPFITLVLLPAVLGAFWKFPNFMKVVIGMVINCLVSPLAIILVIYLINKRSLAGQLKASPVRNIMLAYSLAVMLFTCFMAAKGLWGQFAAEIARLFGA